jgi:hypothetical protein
MPSISIRTTRMLKPQQDLDQYSRNEHQFHMQKRQPLNLEDQHNSLKMIGKYASTRYFHGNIDPNPSKHLTIRSISKFTQFKASNFKTHVESSKSINNYKTTHEHSKGDLGSGALLETSNNAVVTQGNDSITSSKKKSHRFMTMSSFSNNRHPSREEQLKQIRQQFVDKTSDLYDNCYQIRKILPQGQAYDRNLSKIRFLY